MQDLKYSYHGYSVMIFRRLSYITLSCIYIYIWYTCPVYIHVPIASTGWKYFFINVYVSGVGNPRGGAGGCKLGKTHEFFTMFCRCLYRNSCSYHLYIYTTSLQSQSGMASKLKYLWRIRLKGNQGGVKGLGPIHSAIMNFIDCKCWSWICSANTTNLSATSRMDKSSQRCDPQEWNHKSQ